MDTNKVWGIILIIVGVIFTLMGVGSVYSAYTFSSQMGQITGMLGAGSQMVDAMSPSKLPGLIMIVIGVGSAYIGTKLLKKVSA